MPDLSDRSAFELVLHNDLESFLAKVFGSLKPTKTYLHNWHIAAICYRLEQLRRGEIRRLIINLPPRSLKTTLASVAFPAFVLGQDPTKQIVCATYGDELSREIARQCRAIMMTDWYQHVFPATRISRSRNAEHDFQTTRGGGRLSTSVGGPLTGRGGSMFIIDDPHKGEEVQSAARRKSVIDWYANTLSSRLDDKKNDTMLLVTQRIHEDDLPGHLLKSEGWTLLSLPAIAVEDEIIELGCGETHHRRRGDFLHPAREAKEELDRARRDMGTANFEAQYQQSPVPEQGNMVQADWFRTYDTIPQSENTFRQIVQSWDFAVRDDSHNDWTVCITALIQGNDIYLLDVFRQRLDYPRQR